MSFGHTHSQSSRPEEDVEFIAVRKALDSLVTIILADAQGQSLDIQTGLIVADPDGDIQVLTDFSAFYWLVEAGYTLSVINRKGREFSVKEIKRISLLDNLISFTVNGDITEGGRFSPVPAAGRLEEEEPLFYTFFSNSRFQAKRVEKALSFPERLDFLIDTRITDVSKRASFVLNQKGEVVSLITHTVEQTLFGSTLIGLWNFLTLGNDVPLVNMFEAEGAEITWEGKWERTQLMVTG